MKQLSLTSINIKAPLEVSLTPSGTFTFGTDKNRYVVGFVEGDVILDAAFHGGCNGNLKGIVALSKGQKISEVKERLAGITCGGKNTSCPDQFAQLLALVSEK